MSNHTCGKCGKKFTEKSKYSAHLKRKTPCVTVTFDIIEEPESEPDVININININTFDHLVGSHSISVPKPILKWVGGKTQILDTLIQQYPVHINNYREIFLGGGSMLLALLKYKKDGIIKVHDQIYAYDLNEPLIGVYKNIQSCHNELFAEITRIIAEFNSCNTQNGILNREPKTLEEALNLKENYYYWTRIQYNKLSLEQKTAVLGSAMFIFLNKTCFRGVFRVGPNGFNVPYGHYDKPEIINEAHLNAIHELIQGVIFECSDFTNSLSNVEANDFVYLDPPYAPETATSFVKYTDAGFPVETHLALFGLCHELTQSNKKFMLSNSDVSLVRDNFTAAIHSSYNENIKSILCRRAINSKNPDAKAKEVIIRNY